MKKFYSILSIGLLISSLMFSCSDEAKVIPPALEPPVPENPQKPDEDIFNNPEFPLHEDGAPFNTYRGLVMVGYQGWFGAPGDGCKHSDASNTEWYHYRESEVFKPGVLQNSIDFWPDMSEYTVKYTPGVDGSKDKSAKFILPNGESAQVFSSYDESSVLLHFKWMKDYAIDGVFMQRFVGEVIDNPAGMDHFDTVLRHAMKGSNLYQRAICVMYDLGGFNEGKRDVNALLEDAQKIMNSYRLLDRNQQKYYLYEENKPLLALWGVGFEEKPFDADLVFQLVQALKAQGWSIMLGVNDNWRTYNSAKWPRAKYSEVVKNADIIFPWYVGRYGDVQGYKNRMAIIEQDIRWCKENGVHFVPHCYPGGADRNMHPNNAIVDRLGGKFFWEQIYGGIKLGAEMLYVGMFDEIDEGTAIFKCLNKKDVPSNVPETDYYVWYNAKKGSYGRGLKPIPESQVEGGWCMKASELGVTFQGVEDNLPTDHYLWLTGQASKMLRGEIPLKNTWPMRE